VIGYVEHEEHRRKKNGGDKEEKKGEKEEEKEIWSGTDGMYDATEYMKKKKSTEK